MVYESAVWVVVVAVEYVRKMRLGGDSARGDFRRTEARIGESSVNYGRMAVPFDFENECTGSRFSLYQLYIPRALIAASEDVGVTVIDNIAALSNVYEAK